MSGTADRGLRGTSLRIPERLLERADALRAPLAEVPAYAAARVDRATVLRLALARGLLSLERETAAHRAVVEATTPPAELLASGAGPAGRTPDPLGEAKAATLDAVEGAGWGERAPTAGDVEA